MYKINTNHEYLKEIYKLTINSNKVRSIEIANSKNVSKAAVSTRLKYLKNLDYVIMDKKGVSLTQKGKKIAENLHQKYSLFKSFLEASGFDEENADNIASISSHIINSNSLRRCSE